MQEARKRQQGQNPDVKRRIIDAAEHLFADKGFDATSISDITKEADVARALIYYYFKDKLGLYESIIQDGNDYVGSCAQEAADTIGSTLDRLRVFMARLRQLHIDRPSHSRLTVRAYLENNLSFDQKMRESFSRVSTLLGQIITEGINKGELRDVDVDKTIHMVMGIVHSLVMMQIQSNYVNATDRDIDFAIEILEHGIGKDPASQPASSGNHPEINGDQNG